MKPCVTTIKTICSHQFAVSQHEPTDYFYQQPAVQVEHPMMKFNQQALEIMIERYENRAIYSSATRKGLIIQPLQALVIRHYLQQNIDINAIHR